MTAAHERVAMHVVCCMQMSEANLRNHITPLARHPDIDSISIVRRTPLQTCGITKVCILVPYAGTRLVALPLLLCFLLMLPWRHDVSLFVSFNPVPYGLMTLIAAKLWRKSVHLGFVGSDWNRSLKGWLGRVMMPILRRADFFTCTGTKMRDEMIARGFPADRIAILPHSIDLDKARISSPDKAVYDCIFIGLLDQNKRIDTILRAFAAVAQRHPKTRLCIVGDGPLRTRLEEIASHMGIEEHVEFAGHTTDVFSYLQRSRISIIASESEGLPFALVEAMCCGLVPVCTPVGTIPDYITHGETGLLFPVGDHAALANCILTLLENPELYTRIRTNVLALRDQFSYEKATAVWDRFLTACAR